MKFTEMTDIQTKEKFEAIKNEIMIKNYIKIMQEKLIPYYDTLAMAKGVAKSQEEIYDEAHEAFCEAKKRGTIDELNNLIVQ